MRFVVRLVINALALLVIAYFFHLFGLRADSIGAGVIGALLLGIANAIVRPILIVISCPLEILSLGLFTLIINGLIFYFVLRLVPGFHVPGYWAAFWGSIVMSVVSWLLSLLVGEERRERAYR